MAGSTAAAARVGNVPQHIQFMRQEPELCAATYVHLSRHLRHTLADRDEQVLAETRGGDGNGDVCVIQVVEAQQAALASADANATGS